jgi:hypothetical protein
MADLPEIELIDLPPGELVALVTALSLEAWAMMGAELPEYRRAEIPGRVVRQGQD